MNRWRDEEVRHRVGVRGKICDRVDWKILKGMGNVVFMSGERLTGRVYGSEVKRRRNTGRQSTRLLDRVEKACSCEKSRLCARIENVGVTL